MLIVKKHPLRSVVTALALSFGLCGNAFATAYMWKTSVTSGNWETSGNWTTAGSPSTTSDTAAFPKTVTEGTTVTVTKAHTIKSLSFANTNAMTLVLSDVSLGYTGNGHCKIGATGSVTVEFNGTGAQLKDGSPKSCGNLYFGNEAGVGTTTLKFTLANDTFWDDSNAPILATGGDNPVTFYNNTKIVVDARALDVPDPNAPLTFSLAYSADGMRFSDGSTVIDQADIRCPDGACGEIAMEGNALVFIYKSVQEPEPPAPTPGNLVNRYTFDDIGGEGNVNLLKATVGEDAIAYKNTTAKGGATPETGLGGLSVCTDEAATAGLDEGSHAVAIPLGKFLAIPHGIATTNAAPWCMRMRCYAPTSLTDGYLAFYTLEQANNNDAALFCSFEKGMKVGSSKWNGADGGYAGKFTLGAWHDLVVSFNGITATVYVDGTENRVLARAGTARRAESLKGKEFIYISADNDGEDQLLYVDEIEVYDAARPYALFPLDVAHTLETLPWQQNVYTNRFTIMCETKSLVPGLELQYGADYASSVQMTSVSGYGGRYIYSGRVTLDGCPGASVPYRLAVGGTPLAADGDRTAEGVVRLWPDDPDETFTCAIWGDNQQGAKDGDWDADKYLYINKAFRQMVADGVDFGITSGDMASHAKYEEEIRPCLLDATDALFGRTRPYYLAWGNHDTYLAPRNRIYCETGSLNDPDYLDSNKGAYYMYRGNVLFVFIHWGPDATTATWLADLLATPRAKAAKFRVLVQHAPMYLEVWGENHDDTLLATAQAGGVDIVFSGHMHGYERIHDDKGLVQLTNGGMGYLDHTEHVVNDYGSWTKLGGHMDVPYLWARQASKGVLGKMGPVRMGCVTSYCEMKVSGNELNVRAFGFNADGSPIGVFDDFTLVSKTVSAPAAQPASTAACANAASFDAFTETPVTNAKWKEYKDAVGEPFEYAAGKGDSPVVNVSKTEIGRFLAWLNAGAVGGDVYRLPTLTELKAKRTTLAGDVTEWTDTVDASTGWCRLLGGNALASNGVWTAATDKPAIATAGCHANYLGFRLVKGEAPVPPPSTSLVRHYTFDNAEDLFAATVGTPGKAYDTNEKAPVEQAGLGVLYATNVTDGAGVAHAVAIPKGASFGFAHGIGTTTESESNWCIEMRVYIPATTEKYSSFIQLNQANDGDAFLFRKGTSSPGQIGGGSGNFDYDDSKFNYYSDRWHTVVVSVKHGFPALYLDKELMLHPASCTFSLVNRPLLFMAADDSGEDTLMFFDYIKVYDEASPAELDLPPYDRGNSCIWLGGAADNNWSTGANWELGSAPTSSQYAIFPSYNKPNQVAVDWENTALSLTVADFYAEGDVTMSGGKTFYIPVSGASGNYNILTRGMLEVTGAGTDAHFLSTNTKDKYVALGSGSGLKVSDGGKMDIQKLHFSDNDDFTIVATNADSTLTLTTYKNTANLDTSCKGIVFAAYDGGKVTSTSSPRFYKLDPKFIADGGTLTLGSFYMNQTGFTVESKNGGYVKLGAVDNRYAAATITVDGASTFESAGTFCLPYSNQGVKPALTLSGVNPKLNMSNNATLGYNGTGTPSYFLTMNLKPELSWAANGTRISVASGKTLTIYKGVKYAVDVTAFTNYYGKMSMVLAQAGGTLTYTAPSAGWISKKGAGEANCTVALVPGDTSGTTSSTNMLSLVVTSENAVPPETAVAAVNADGAATAFYDSLEEALKAAPSGAGVALIKNVSVGNLAVDEGKTVSIYALKPVTLTVVGKLGAGITIGDNVELIEKSGLILFVK